MNLDYGKNIVTFAFSENGIGQIYKATLIVWLFTPVTRFIITDIDGTITRHELGGLCPGTKNFG